MDATKGIEARRQSMRGTSTMIEWFGTMIILLLLGRGAVTAFSAVPIVGVGGAGLFLLAILVVGWVCLTVIWQRDRS